MGDYLWPGLVAAILLGFAAWRFSKCWTARRRAWAAWTDVHCAVAKRREAGLELAAAMRAFRPRDPAVLTRLEAAAAAAREAERRTPAGRVEAERAFDEALARLPGMIESDALLRIHGGCRRGLDKLRAAGAELGEVCLRYNQAVRGYEAEAHRFPNNIVLHTIDVSPPQAWECAIPSAAGGEAQPPDPGEFVTRSAG